MQSYLCEYVKIMKEKYKLEHIPCLLQSKVSKRASPEVCPKNQKSTNMAPVFVPQKLPSCTDRTNSHGDNAVMFRSQVTEATDRWPCHV